MQAVRQWWILLPWRVSKSTPPFLSTRRTSLLADTIARIEGGMVIEA